MTEGTADAPTWTTIRDTLPPSAELRPLAWVFFTARRFACRPGRIRAGTSSGNESRSGSGRDGSGGILAAVTDPDIGELGVLGMHLEGYGCRGMSATEYGVACLELEASDSGLRSLVSVQGSLAMFAIWRWGSEG